MSTDPRDLQSTAPEPPSTEPTREAQVDRRRFLRHAVAAGGVIGVSSWAALAPSGWPLSLRDPTGDRGKPMASSRRLPSGGYVPGPAPLAADLGIARGQRVDAMLKSAVDAVGGISRFVSRGDVVLIKPNVAFERSAALGATTNPAVLSQLIRLVRDAGAREVRVADNPIESPESCFVRSGIQQAAIDAGARIYLPRAGAFETLRVDGATWIEEWPVFWQPLDGVDKVIGVSPVKDHNLCRASMTTKNWYGLLGGRRNQFHQDIHGIIADLALMMRPTLVVLDGTRVLFRSGPTGGSLDDVRPGATIAVSTDSLAVDAFGWDDLLGRSGEALPEYFTRCEARGLGQPRWKTLRIREEQLG